jgi:septal ring factor EnvC (AmiA/AmiB activator)
MVAGLDGWKPICGLHFLKKSLTLLLILAVCASSFGQQSRKSLEEKRKKLLKEIEQTTSLLKQTKQTREATFSRYLTLQKQIGKRRQLLETMQAEIQLIVENVDRTVDVVNALNDDIGNLKTEYAKMARHAYRQRLTRSDWLFLFSAKNFNDAFRRWQYLRQYNRYRQRQARLIVETQKTLLDKITMLEERKQEREHLIDAEKRQSEMLGLEMNAKNRMLEDLKGDEARLARELDQKRSAAEKLSAAIEKVILEEIEKAKRAERPAVANSGPKPSATPETNLLSKDFQNNKGKLPWPVKNGVITGYFGRQQHPTIKSVEITNNGIDIRTDQGSPVRAVFEGTVVGTQFIPGFDYMVIIQHGEYYTVYSNLEEVSVRKGDKIAVRQNLGKVSTNRKTNTSEVHFEIWREKTRLNPVEWVGSQ